MKKGLLTLAAACLFAFAAKAQTSYGIKAGLNFPQASLSSKLGTVNSESTTNFYLTGYMDAPIASNLSIQPGVSLQGKGFKSTIGKEDLKKTDLMYIEIPVNFVYYVPVGAGDIFLGAGPYAAFGISAKNTVGGNGKSGSFSDSNLNTVDAGLNFLVGYKLAGGFLINGGYGLGLTNMAKNGNNFSSMKNKVFSVGVGFQL